MNQLQKITGIVNSFVKSNDEKQFAKGFKRHRLQSEDSCANEDDFYVGDLIGEDATDNASKQGVASEKMTKKQTSKSSLSSLKSCKGLKSIGTLLKQGMATNLSPYGVHEDSTSEESQSKRQGVDHSLDKESFLERVATFKDHRWCRDAPALSPLEVARHGWFSTEDDLMVRCCSCRENLSLELPSPDSGIIKPCIDAAYKRLSAAHSEFCPWAASSCPIDWTRARIPPIESVTTTAVAISELGSRLPHIQKVVLDEWTPVLLELEPNIEIVVDDPMVKTVSLLLALCGWRVAKLPECLTDEYNIRRVGLWNFISIQEEEDFLEERRVAKELGHDVSDERSEMPEGKLYFSLIDEHLSWHPLRQVAERGLTGTKYIIDFYTRIRQRREDKLREEEEGKHSKHENQDIVKKVRNILNQW